MPLKRKFDTTTAKRSGAHKHMGYTLTVRDHGGHMANINRALLFDTEEVPLSKRSITVGRGDMNEIDIRDESGQVSRIHAKIEFEDGKYYITDVDSTNKTYVNGNPIERRKRILLNVGDTILFAACVKAAMVEHKPPEPPAA